MNNGNWRDWWKELGNDFWNEPASRRGMHAPGETQKSHARGVFLLAASHWRRVPWRHVRKDRFLCRSFLRAALFHDVGKKFDRDQHEIKGFEWMLPRDRLAAFLVLHHMGRWGPDAAERVALMMDHDCMDLHTPQNLFLSDLIAAADYTQACCFKAFGQSLSRNPPIR